MNTHFVKIHAPWDTLCNIAEDIMMQMPIKVQLLAFQSQYLPLLLSLSPWFPLIAAITEVKAEKK